MPCVGNLEDPSIGWAQGSGPRPPRPWDEWRPLGRRQRPEQLPRRPRRVTPLASVDRVGTRPQPGLGPWLPLTWASAPSKRSRRRAEGTRISRSRVAPITIPHAWTSSFPRPSSTFLGPSRFAFSRPPGPASPPVPPHLGSSVLPSATSHTVSFSPFRGFRPYPSYSPPLPLRDPP